VEKCETWGFNGEENSGHGLLGCADV